MFSIVVFLNNIFFADVGHVTGKTSSSWNAVGFLLAIISLCRESVEVMSLL